MLLIHEMVSILPLFVLFLTAAHLAGAWAVLPLRGDKCAAGGCPLGPRRLRLAGGRGSHPRLRRRRRPLVVCRREARAAAGLPTGEKALKKGRPAPPVFPAAGPPLRDGRRAAAGRSPLRQETASGGIQEAGVPRSGPQRSRQGRRSRGRLPRSRRPHCRRDAACRPSWEVPPPPLRRGVARLPSGLECNPAACSYPSAAQCQVAPQPGALPPLLHTESVPQRFYSGSLTFPLGMHFATPSQSRLWFYFWV